MKIIALKSLVAILSAFAVYYAYFLGSVFYELHGPNAAFCGTGQAWALQGAALFFAPPALLGSVGLWFVAKSRILGSGFSLASRAELVVLTLCALANIVIFIPAF